MPGKKYYPTQKTVKKIRDVQSIKYDENGEEIKEIRIVFSKLDLTILKSSMESINDLQDLSSKSFGETLGFLIDLGSSAFIKMKED